MADKNLDSELKEDGKSGGAASAQRAKEETAKSSEPGGAQEEKAAGDTFEKAKNSTEKIVGQALGTVKEKAAAIVDEQRGGLAASINGIADAVRQIGDNLNRDGENQIAALAGGYGNNLAEQIERISGYVEDKEFGEIAQDVEKFARRNPALFVGAAFTFGVLAARFLKSSAGKKSRR